MSGDFLSDPAGLILEFKDITQHFHYFKHMAEKSKALKYWVIDVERKGTDLELAREEDCFDSRAAAQAEVDRRKSANPDKTYVVIEEVEH